MAERGSSGKPPAATYQARIHSYSGVGRAAGDAALSAYAGLYGRVQRKLFAEMAAGRSAASLKNEYLGRYGMPARMFNGMRVSLEGKVASVKEQQKLRLDSLGRRIAWAEGQIADAAGRSQWDQVHQKRRRLTNLRSRLAELQEDVGAGRVRLCFGSKKLWRKQHHLADNGYASQDEWLADWRGARSDEFFVLGSRDETAGCQLCVASVADDGTLTLRLRLPDCLAGQYGKYITIEEVSFAYGHEQLLAALQSNAEYARYRREHGEKATRATGLGQAVSYRFKRDGKGWRMFATTAMMDVPVVTDRGSRCHRGGPERRPPSGLRNRRQRQLRQRLQCAAGNLRKEAAPSRSHHRRRRGQRRGSRQRLRQAHRHRAAGLPAEESVTGG